jgi:hypothetical protein
MWKLIALFVILIVTLVWITHRPLEAFADTADENKDKDPKLDKDMVANVAKLLDIKEGEAVDPHIVFGKLRGLIDKYDNPDFTRHIQRISGMDPGQMARMNL